MIRNKYLLSLLTYWASLIALSAQENVTVTTASGAVVGALSNRSNGVYRFLAIPYANPPERFEKAELVTPWEGVKDATQYGKSCMQHPVTDLFPLEEMSEDCLTLDIYTPVPLIENKTDVASRRAVMVWIHGGGFLSGNSKLFESSLLSERGDVVVVVLQYRLGTFGFLYTQGETPANLGLWDQRLALQWIRNNIEAFGGDSDSITVFGESAGAISISCHLISPEVNNTLFSRAILQSGAVLNGDKTLNERDKAVWRVAKAGGCLEANSTTRSQRSLLDCLKRMESLSLVTAASQSGVTFWPTTGDSYMPLDSLEILDRYYRFGVDAIRDKVGGLASYDILIGHNGDEGIVMLPYIFPSRDISRGVTTTQYQNAMQGHTIQPLVKNTSCLHCMTDMLTSFYSRPFQGMENRTEMEKNLKYSTEFIGDFVLKIPQIHLTLLHADLTKEQTDRKSTYYYEFDHKPERPSPTDAGPDWLKTSASHTDELQFIFSLLPDFTGPANFSQAELDLSHSLVSYWTGFAKHGNPPSQMNVARGSTRWKQFTSSERSYLRLTTAKDILECRPRDYNVDIWLGILSNIFNQKMDKISQ